MRIISLLLIILFISPGYALKMTPLTGKQIKPLLSGKLVLFTHVNQHTPELGLNTIADNLLIAFYDKGTMSGMFTFSRQGHNQPMISDTGKWWIKGNKECWKWHNWEQHTKFCVNWFDNGKQYVVLHDNTTLAGIIKKRDIV